VLDKAVVGQDAGFSKAIHTFSNLGEDMAMVDEWGEAILLHDIVRNVFRRNAHRFVAIHWRAEAKIYNVGSEHFCIWGGHGAVEENLDGLLFSGRSADFAFVVDAVAANGEVDAVRFDLVHHDGCNNA